MQRDGASLEEAQDRIWEFKRELEELLTDSDAIYEDACYLVEDHFGLEPDYLEDFLV